MKISSSELLSLETFALGLLQNNPLQSNELIQLSLGGKIGILPGLTREQLIQEIAKKAGGTLEHGTKVEHLTQRFSSLVDAACRNRLTSSAV